MESLKPSNCLREATQIYRGAKTSLSDIEADLAENVVQTGNPNPEADFRKLKCRAAGCRMLFIALAELNGTTTIAPNYDAPVMQECAVQIESSKKL